MNIVIDDIERFDDASPSMKQITLPMPAGCAGHPSQGRALMVAARSAPWQVCAQGCATLRQRATPADATCDRSEQDGQREAMQPHGKGGATANPSQGITWRAWSSALSAAPDQRQPAPISNDLTITLNNST